MAGPQRQTLDFLGGREVEVAPQADLPRTSFFSIEYPAHLRHGSPKDGFDPNNHPSLSNALRSLSPLPPPYATPSSALRHMGQLAEKSGRVMVECRLGQACLYATSQGVEAGSSRLASSNDVYRHAVVGEVVDAHNVVMKVTKRVWRRKSRGSGEVRRPDGERKEYTAVAMGITRRVARFRNLADFLYDPGYVDDPEKGEREAMSQALELHDSLRKMDIEALRSFHLSEEKEEYEMDKAVRGKGVMRVSNIRMPPAPVFDKTDVPFTYGFRQNPTSYLGVYGKASEDGVRPMRYMNKLKYGNMAPISLSLSTKAGRGRPIPSKANEDVLKSRRMNDELFGQLQEMFQRQPMWSRISLLNQFEPDQRRNLVNQKHYIAASCYTINDGCWRDTLVRFGYDPREDMSSRFYQKLSFQLKPRAKKASLQQNQSNQASVSADGDHLGSVSRQDASPMDDDVDSGDSHIFDGITPSRTRGNYLLLDVVDELVRPLIDQTGNVLRDTPNRDTGWYTQKQWDKIRMVMQLRFRKLLDEGVPATREECDALLAVVDSTTSKAIKPSRPKRPSGLAV